MFAAGKWDMGNFLGNRTKYNTIGERTTPECRASEHVFGSYNVLDMPDHIRYLLNMLIPSCALRVPGNTRKDDARGDCMGVGLQLGNNNWATSDCFVWGGEIGR